MKVLSVRQPYATLICAGIKTVENRLWSTDYRGPLLIHSSAGFDCEIFDKSLPLNLWQEFDKKVSMEGILTKPSSIIDIVNNVLILKDEQYRREFDLLKKEIARQADFNDSLFSLSSIIGVVDLVDIRTDYIDAWSDPGKFHWILKNPVLFANSVRQVKGQLRLWQFDGIIDTKPV